METLIALTIGLLTATGIYRLLGGTKIDVVIGIILLSQAANLIILASGGLKHGAAALLEDGITPDPAILADPLPQALVLTAIVIGFAILAFMFSLVTRSSEP